MGVIKDFFEKIKYGHSLKELEVADLNRMQHNEVMEGLSKLQVALYANKPTLTHIQIKEVRFGLEGNLSNSQVEMYDKSTLLPEQMEEIRKDFESGLNKKQVEFLISQSYLMPQQMREVRIGLDNDIYYFTVRIWD